MTLRKKLSAYRDWTLAALCTQQQTELAAVPQLVFGDATRWRPGGSLIDSGYIHSLSDTESQP